MKYQEESMFEIIILVFFSEPCADSFTSACLLLGSAVGELYGSLTSSFYFYSVIMKSKEFFRVSLTNDFCLSQPV